MNEFALTGWALVALVAVLLALWIVWGAASRLDRLHRRLLGARTTLDAQLVRRATAAWDLAISGYLDPASSIIVATAARDALDHMPGADADLEPPETVAEALTSGRQATHDTYPDAVLDAGPCRGIPGRGRHTVAR